MSYRNIKPGTFEYECYILGKFEFNITIAKDRNELILKIEQDLHTLRRFKTNKIKPGTARMNSNFPRIMEKDLRDILTKLKDYSVS